ncbi:MAG: sugar phosphate isomerase/epimerase [Verrucomicrobiota bacterium]|nr:sugar phosphate isomerase/epimerase [Verrucomicrobiota bacterium]
MKFCLNTSTIKPQPLLKKIELAATAGYDGIELWLNDIYDYVGRGGEVCEVERALADYGLIVPSTIAIRQWGDMDGWEYELVKDEARRRFALAARLGAPYIVATPPLELENQDHLPERFRDLLQIGREEGIQPTFEYISFFKSVYNLADAWRIVQETDDKDSTLILDAFHTWNSKSDMELLREIPVEKISHYHIDDAHPDKASTTQKDPDRVMLGEGQIDLAAEIVLLKEKGYDKTMSLELFNEELWRQDPLEVISVGLKRMKELWG